MSRVEVIDPQVDVDLLRRSIRPLGRYVVRCELNSHTWRTVDEHRVPVVLGVDRPAEHLGPKAALGGQVSCVKNHDLVVELHSGNLCTHARVGVGRGCEALATVERPRAEAQRGTPAQESFPAAWPSVLRFLKVWEVSALLRSFVKLA